MFKVAFVNGCAALAPMFSKNPPNPDEVGSTPPTPKLILFPRLACGSKPKPAPPNILPPAYIDAPAIAASPRSSPSAKPPIPLPIPAPNAGPTPGINNPAIVAISFVFFLTNLFMLLNALFKPPILPTY